MGGQRVHVTEHALTRGRERCSPPLHRRQIREEVAAALEEGRIAKRPPAWACPPGSRYRQAAGKPFRHTWPPCLSRCYIIERRRTGVSVVTVIVPPELDVATGAA